MPQWYLKSSADNTADGKYFFVERVCLQTEYGVKSVKAGM
jgi:hypothetical protein